MKAIPKLVYPQEGALYTHPRPLLPVEVYMYNGIESEEEPDRVIARFYGEGKGPDRLLSAVALADMFVGFYNYTLEQGTLEDNVWADTVFTRVEYDEPETIHTRDAKTWR